MKLRKYNFYQYPLSVFQALSCKGKTDVCSSARVINLLRDIQQWYLGPVRADILNGGSDDEKINNAH